MFKNEEEYVNLRLGTTVETIELETLQHLLLDVALKNHKEKFTERDSIMNLTA